jgi:hypothetical protein
LDLGQTTIQEIGERAQRFPGLRAWTQAGVWAREVALTCARGVVRFDAGAPTGLVLADFLSNRLFHKLRGRTQPSLELVTAQTATAMSLPLACAPVDASATRALPTICSDGLARDRIREAYLGEKVTAEGVAPSWNREQAARWIGFAGKAERSRRG